MIASLAGVLLATGVGLGAAFSTAQIKTGPASENIKVNGDYGNLRLLPSATCGSRPTGSAKGVVQLSVGGSQAGGRLDDTGHSLVPVAFGANVHGLVAHKGYEFLLVPTPDGQCDFADATNLEVGSGRGQGTADRNGNLNPMKAAVVRVPYDSTNSNFGCGDYVIWGHRYGHTNGFGTRSGALTFCPDPEPTA
jgi:hypothetical protein